MEIDEFITISIHAPHEGERLQKSFDFNQLLCNFNPRSPRGGATVFSPSFLFLVYISIHAPHEGERQTAWSMELRAGGFQSTLPTRGSDHILTIFCTEDKNFNPRSPRGGATRARGD